MLRSRETSDAYGPPRALAYRGEYVLLTPSVVAVIIAASFPGSTGGGVMGRFRKLMSWTLSPGGTGNGLVRSESSAEQAAREQTELLRR
jgi:hypothetical protein